MEGAGAEVTSPAAVRLTPAQESQYGAWERLALANGNLADGTPHASTIFLAFDRHGISCGLSTDTKNKDSAECPTIGSVGNISATPGANQVTIAWNSATNAGNYRVLRNNLGCTYGFTQIAVVAAPTLSYVDTTASNGTTWYYVVQPIGTNVDCTGPISRRWATN